MKTCPLNKVVTWDGPIATQAASWLGINARWMKPFLIPIAVKLDDWLGHGIRNPKKRWWLDLEIVDGVCVEPRKGVNERDLDYDPSDDNSRFRYSQARTGELMVEEMSGYSVLWVLGTSIGFEVVILFLAWLVFVRRDF